MRWGKENRELYNEMRCGRECGPASMLKLLKRIAYFCMLLIFLKNIFLFKNTLI